jgi:non-heme chloroperoxidase
MLVLGAEDDVVISQDEVRETAAAFGTRAELFPGMAHDMMLEKDWQKVAERIAGWLQEHDL